MINLMEYKIIPEFINDEELNTIKQLFENNNPNLKWFKMKNYSSISLDKNLGLTNKFLLCRSQTEVIRKNNKAYSQLFEIIENALSKYNLKLLFDRIGTRKYEIGDFMGWHSDFDLELSETKNTVLEYECVLVLENTSDSMTQFKVEDSSTDKVTIESYVSKEKDVLILCRRGIKHQVTPLTKGSRLTLKFTACNK